MLPLFGFSGTIVLLLHPCNLSCPLYELDFLSCVSVSKHFVHLPVKLARQVQQRLRYSQLWQDAGDSQFSKRVYDQRPIALQPTRLQKDPFPQSGIFPRIYRDFGTVER